MTAGVTPEPGGRRLELAGWLFVAATLTLLGLTRLNCSDLPWHLATARLAEQLGHWPTRNTFSWTFPDYPLFQQYPAFQSLLWALFKLGGWPALSLLLFAWWSLVFALFVRAAGPFRRALPFAVFWGLVAFSLQARNVLRPDLVSLTLLALLLIVLDGYRRRRGVIALVPVLHWLWVNGHQLFVLSFAVQALFVVHLLLARWGRLGQLGIDSRDAGLPVWPPLLALAASVALTFATPLGAGVVHVFAHTSGSLASHRADVQELARVWSDPVWLAIGLVITVPTALVQARSRRAVDVFELGLWLMAMAIAVSAIRGLVYATLVSGVVFQRTLLREPLEWRLSSFLQRYFRVLGVFGCAALAFAVLYHRWLHPTVGIGGAQAGLGQSEGDWPHAAVAALKPDPPPGQMMNLSWSFANDLIWEWPEQPVFVDPRFEAYPRAFLVEALASRHSDEVLGRLLARYRPGWLFVEHCAPSERARVATLVSGGHWQVTYADVQTVVLVSRSPRSEEYRARHPFAPASEPPGLSIVPLRRARQRLCYAQLLGRIGFVGPARAQLGRAASEGGSDAELRAAVARAAQALPVGTTAQ
jgi:hypothetical protein